MVSLTNAGRWGADDRLGAMNLITADTRLAALGLARSGTVVSLMRPIVLTPKSAAIAADDLPDGNPYYEMRVRLFPSDSRYTGFSSDIQEYAMHGPLLTHLDALCHDSYNGRFYNDVAVAGTVDPTSGCATLDITPLLDGVITRGVLIDFPRLRGRALEQGERLTPDDLDTWERQAGVKVRPGDAVLLYTGLTAGKPDIGAGYDLSMMPWFKARDVALIGSDGPNADHQLSLASLGVNLLDNAELGGLAETAARLKRWEFLLVVAPTGPRGATGAVVNPLAVF
jgi:kynurenine formamidase